MARGKVLPCAVNERPDGDPEEGHVVFLARGSWNAGTTGTVWSGVLSEYYERMKSAGSPHGVESNQTFGVSRCGAQILSSDFVS